MQKTDRQLSGLSLRLNKRNLKTRKQIREEIDSILKRYNVEQFLNINIYENKEETRVQIGRGRPGLNTKYKIYTRTHYSLFWEPDKKKLKQEESVDGIFPLLTTDKSFGPKEVLLSYKYQPRLEKRFNQFKSVHEAAPLLFKNIKRVEGIMFLFFVALIIQVIRFKKHQKSR